MSGILVLAAEATERPGLRLAPDTALVVTRSGAAFLLAMGSSFYALSASGAFLLKKALLEGEAKAAEAAAATYGIARDEAAGDLSLLLAELRDCGLIAGQAAAPQAAGAGARAIAAMARRVSRMPGLKARAVALLALARLSFLARGWVRTVAAWREAFPLAAAPAPNLSAIDQAVRAMSAKVPFGGNCKERALTAWALARAAGVPAALVVGFVFHPLNGHTWCEAGGRIIGDTADHCAPYEPVFRYE